MNTSEKRSSIKSKYRDNDAIPIDEFFDGNDDSGSIGCNLDDHPGIETFSKYVLSLKNLEGVKEIFVLVSELDPGEENWPFTDTLCIVGDIDPKVVEKTLSPIQPNEVYRVGFFSPSHLKSIAKSKDAPLVVVWWD